MKTVPRLVFVTVLALVSAREATVRAMPPGEDGHRVAEAAALIRDLELEKASPLLAELEHRHPHDSDVLDTVALLDFHRGRYAEAAKAIRTADVGEPKGTSKSQRAELTSLFESTRDTTAKFVDFAAENGRYVVRVAPGVDEFLVPYALDALMRADRAVSAVFGYRHPGPIRLEVYDSPATLARVSSLTVEEIERTGTIALCKWDRLMITSPRALVRGYPWMDTIGHEFVHLALSRATHDRAPVWFQEGVAKYLEVRWRGAKALRLDPSAEVLLAKAIATGKLIPFDKLHPSIARLPSQEDAALAFAQVATFIAQLVEEHGEEALRDVIKRIAAGADAREAVAAATGDSWDHAESEWRALLKAQHPVPPKDPPKHIPMRFKKGNGVVDESLDVSEKHTRDHLRLGDLLWGHGRASGASGEYARAQKLSPDDPIVASRFARASVRAGKPDLAVGALMPLRDRYPQHAPLHALLGRALLDQGNRVEARHELLEAIWLNPFDPDPHCGLSQISENVSERDRETIACHGLAQ